MTIIEVDEKLTFDIIMPLLEPWDQVVLSKELHIFDFGLALNRFRPDLDYLVMQRGNLFLIPKNKI